VVVVCTETLSWGGSTRGIGANIGPGGGDEGGDVGASELIKFESVRRRTTFSAGSLLEKKGFARDP
jgi:hypothetical protein